MADIIESVANQENLTKLVEVVKATELVETLKSPGPYTVFAPTDEAFAKLPEETLNTLLNDATKLKRIVAHHIGFGDVRKEDLLEIQEVMTMEGSVIAVDNSDKQIKLNQANVITSDILTDNGVIHVIDQVLIPALVLSE